MTTPTTAQLNALQDAGIISDLCVTWADVPFQDRERALRWLGIAVAGHWEPAARHGGAVSGGPAMIRMIVDMAS